MTTIGKFYRLTQDEADALNLLLNKGYAFPANSEAAAIRKMLHETWEREFPGKQFAQPNKEIEHDEKSR